MFKQEFFTLPAENQCAAFKHIPPGQFVIESNVKQHTHTHTHIAERGKEENAGEGLCVLCDGSRC